MAHGKYQIFITERAEKNLDETINYLDFNWSEKVKTNFLSRLNQVVEILEHNPYFYQQYSLKKKINKC